MQVRMTNKSYIVQKSGVFMNTYEISKDITQAQPLQISNYPWYKSGNKQNTTIYLAYDQSNLHIKVIAEDAYSFAEKRQTNHMLICENSCFEAFISPFPMPGKPYFNIEIDCTGQLHLAWGEGRSPRKFSTPGQYLQTELSSSLPKAPKEEDTTDSKWQIQAKIPFAILEELSGLQFEKKEWHGNFYRCGGRKDAQYAVWNKINTSEPDYHRSEFFGKLTFQT
jgi:hypothetical protein